MINFLKNFFTNKLSVIAIIFAIIWWLFPISLNLYNIYNDPNLEAPTTLWFHAAFGIFIVLIILRFGSEFFPRKRYSKAEYRTHQLK